ncbi:hypothetical protein CM19_02215 [Candidatus Acidianus copahuensis]|uniref:Uncharacterized protein n=1 Tax=Candidatus Acidianus copahuensis TaxID=1160895 RepID=A0A031LUL3_9CREN|nr:hypothetical protein CM19_02215 [Candidatus Acidianus copahuensis]
MDNIWKIIKSGLNITFFTLIFKLIIVFNLINIEKNTCGQKISTHREEYEVFSAIDRTNVNRYPSLTKT